MTVELDGRLMTDRGTAHDLLKQQLNLPDYYGRNLDALYDLLMEVSAETQITLVDPAAVVNFLGKYGQTLLSTIQEAAENNPNLIMILK